MTQTQKTIGYLLLIVIGWAVGEYPYIPTFQLGFISHIQPDIEVLDKCISITLLAFSLGLFFALWHNLWLMIVMLFITWGMFNNAVDEWTNQAELFGTTEKISLLFALLTTSILIWKHRQK